MLTRVRAGKLRKQTISAGYAGFVVTEKDGRRAKEPGAKTVDHNSEGNLIKGSAT